MQSRTNSPHPTFNMSMASVAQQFQQNSKNVMLGMRNINTKNSPNSNNNLAHDVCITKTWVTTCRQMLIDMESKNIKTRAVFWTQFVNDTTSKTMDKIAHVLSELNIEFSDCTKFLYVVDNAIKHLRFLAEWTGLKTQQMQYMPKSYTEFEYKAKNWLNGRKAPNYALTLFPEMIRHAESYAEITSNVLFKTNKQASNLLSTALRYGYLARLCSAKISLNDTGRKTPLLIENSIKTAKSTTSKIFQQYAIDHPYSSQFPSHTSEAATYFEGKHQECLQRLVMILKSNPNGNNNHNNNTNTNDNNNNNNTNALGPPTNIMPTIPSIPLPSVPIPQIPHIPPLSDGSSHSSNDKMNADSLPTPTPNNNDNNNNCNNFSFNILHNQQGFTVSEINNNNNNNVVSPGSTNSTFNSNNGQFGISSPSSSNLTPNQSNYNSQNVLLPARQYNNLVAQLNRLTETQNTQKDTIHQLLTRLHTLEARIDNNHRLQQQQFLNTSQSISNQSIQDRIQDQLWSNNLSNINNTPSLGYSLAADFANATNSTSINGALTHNKFPNNPATSIGSTQTPTTNSSDTPPVLNNFQLSAFANAHSNNNNNNNQNNDDGDIDIQDNDNQNHHHHNNNNHNHNHNHNNNNNDDVNQSTIPFVGLSMFNDNHNDIHMFSANPNINTFPPFI